MSRVILAEAREIAILMSMLLGLSVLTMLVAAGAVMIAENQTQHVAALAGKAPLTVVDR